jgi:hypothetical protein
MILVSVSGVSILIVMMEQVVALKQTVMLNYPGVFLSDIGSK